MKLARCAPVFSRVRSAGIGRPPRAPTRSPDVPSGQTGESPILAPLREVNVAASRPDLLLVGYGVGDSLQITVQTSRTLARLGRCYVLGLPPNLAAYLRSIHVDAIDLVARLRPGLGFSEAYLALAEAILQEVADDPPVAVISPGNPLLSNSLNRFLLLKARERKLQVQVLPAVSPIDVLIATTGLDVGTFGVQVFDARRIVARQRHIDPSVPLVILELAGLAATDPVAPISPSSEAFEPLAELLRTTYPADHPVTHVADGSAGAQSGPVTVPLSAFATIVSGIGNGSMLFVDLVRAAPGGADSRPR